MKSKVTVLFLVIFGIAASAWAQGGSAVKGRALVESKNCALCHEAGSELGKPMELLAMTNTDARLKRAITNPKKTLGPQVKMPAYKLTNEQLQAIVAYLRSIAKY